MSETVSRPLSPDEVQRRLALLEASLFVAVTAVAVAAYRDVFAGWSDFMVPAGAAAVCGGLTAIVTFRRAMSRSRSLVVGAALGAAFVIYAVLVGTLRFGVLPGPATVRALGHGLLSGFSSILGDSLPVRDTRPARVFVTGLAWIGGFTAAELSLRGRLVALPAIPALVVFGLALPLTAPIGGPSALFTVLFVALVLLSILVRATPEFTKQNRTAAVELHSRGVLSSRLTLGLPLVVVLALVCPLVAAGAVSGDRFDPRDLRAEQVVAAPVIDPLAEYRAIVGRVPSQTVFRVALEGASPADVGRMPVLTLDGFDGGGWYPTGRFGAIGALRKNETADAGGGKSVEATVFVEHLPNLFLPSLSVVTDIDLDSARIDPKTGDVFSTASLDGTSYTVDGRLVQPDNTALKTAQAAVDADALMAVQLPGAEIVTKLTELATAITRDATSTGAKLAQLDEYLRTRYQFDEAGVSGSSYGAVERFLFDTLRGTPEQFAAAFAVLARSIDIPARLVLGYRLVEDRDGTEVPLNDVSTANYHVWAEAKLAGIGWVAYDPTPKGGDVLQPIDLGGGGTSTGAGGSGSTQRPTEAGPREAPAPDQVAGHGYVRLARSVGVGLVAALLAFVVLCAVVVAAKRVRRGRRRSAATPADRITGAWDDVLDRLLEVGMVVPPSLTHRDVTEAASARFGLDTVLPMRAMVGDLTKTVYGPAEPTLEMAESAWRRALELEENLTSSIGRRRALIAKLSLQPFVQRRTDTDDEPTVPSGGSAADGVREPETVGAR